jgi:selenocysteine lyase/cysteine desulfurase
MPQCAIDAAVEMTARRARPSLIPDAEIFATLAESRARLSRLVNCGEGEIALMPNTSLGINLAANALPLGSSDVVLTFEREFPANVHPWLAQRSRGVEARFIPCDAAGLPDEMRMLEELDDKRVRVVAVSWVSFASGYRVDLARLGRECRARGIFLAVDGIQGLGPLTLDLARTEVDIFACGAQKWLLSPWGTGFVYVRDELIPVLQPSNVGWLAFKGSEDFNNLTQYNSEYRDDARKFEAGTLPLQDFRGLNATLSLFETLGFREIEQHVAGLVTKLTEWVLSRGEFRLLSPQTRQQRAGIVSIGVPDPPAVAAALRAADVAFSLREGAIRLAPHMFNTESELARVVEILEATQ